MLPDSRLLSQQLDRRTQTQRLVLVQGMHVVVCIRRDSLGAGLLGSMSGTQRRPGCSSFLILSSRSGVVSRVSKEVGPGPESGSRSHPGGEALSGMWWDVGSSGADPVRGMGAEPQRRGCQPGVLGHRGQASFRGG